MNFGPIKQTTQEVAQKAAMTTRSHLRVREATPADVEAVVDVYFAAFDDNVMNQLMYPRGVSADTKKKFGAKLLPQPPSKDAGQGTTAKGQGFLYVAEYLPDGASADASGEIVAFAKWLLQREPSSEEEWKNEDFTATAEVWGDDCDLGVVDGFIGLMNRTQNEHAKGEAALCKCLTSAVNATTLIDFGSRSRHYWLQSQQTALRGWICPVGVGRQPCRQSWAPLPARSLSCWLRPLQEVWLRGCRSN
jgi:hypothetical protein